MKIKRILSAAFFTLLAIPTFSQDEVVLGVFLHDNPNDAVTNLRSTPKGKIVKQLPHGAYALYLSEMQNGWWKVVDIWDADEVEKLDSTKTYWIHYSVIAMGTRNYGGERLALKATPSSKSKTTYSFNKEILLRPLEIKDGWVKVRTVDGKHTGWIEEDWLCGNPVTNCC